MRGSSLLAVVVVLLLLLLSLQQLVENRRGGLDLLVLLDKRLCLELMVIAGGCSRHRLATAPAVLSAHRVYVPPGACAVVVVAPPPHAVLLGAQGPILVMATDRSIDVVELRIKRLRHVLCLFAYLLAGSC